MTDDVDKYPPPGPIIPEPTGESGPWMTDDDGRLPVGIMQPIAGPELLGVTTGGLPYPESSGPLNQGANDIKALALALDRRGAGFGTFRFRSLMTFTGGRPPGIAVPAGFASIGGFLILGEWGSGRNDVPLTVAIETPVTTVTNIGLLGYMPPPPGGAAGSAQWYTGPAYINLMMWGPLT